MKSKRIKGSSTPSTQDDSGPSDFPAAVTRIAVAQICQSVGFRAAKSSALETLTHVAVRYLQSVAKSAAASAATTGRTQSNLLDVICALEDVHSVLGFSGNSNPTKGLKFLSDSSILSDVRKFVARNREIPFAKPLPRRRYTFPPKPPPCNDVERSDRSNHIPRWLPPIPDIRGGGGGGGCQVVGEIGLERQGLISTEREISKLSKNRDKVSFKIGGGVDETERVFGVVDLRSGVCKGGKRISCQIQRTGNASGSSSSYDNDDDLSMKKRVRMMMKS